MNVIKITSTVTIKAVENRLRDLQQEVQGSFETVRLRDGGIMIVNECVAGSRDDDLRPRADRGRGRRRVHRRS